MQGKPFIIGLAIGIVAGGIIALLYTPNSGEENRKLIKDKIRTIRIKS